MELIFCLFWVFDEFLEAYIYDHELAEKAPMAEKRTIYSHITFLRAVKSSLVEA